MTWAAIAAGITEGAMTLAPAAEGTLMAGTAVPAMGVTGASAAGGAAGAGAGTAAGMGAAAAPAGLMGGGGTGTSQMGAMMKPISEAMEPIMGTLKPPAPNMPPAPQAPNRGPVDMGFDWTGAQDKAEKFIKVAKSVQDFQGALTGQPNPKEKLSQAAPQQPAPYQAPPMPQNPPMGLPSTRLSQFPRGY